MFSIFILCCFAAFNSTAGIHLHRGPSSVAGYSVLRGHTLTKVDRQNKEQKLVDFSVELLSDAIIWDELEEEGFHLTSCFRNEEKNEAEMSITGAQIDRSDFPFGTSFVIETEDWERHCGKIKAVAGIDVADDTLFFKIKSSKMVSRSKNSVWISMVIVSGAEVAPVIDIEVHNRPPLSKPLPKKVIFETREWDPISREELLELAPSSFNATIASRHMLSNRRTVQIVNGAQLEVNSKVSADFHRFRVSRWGKTKISWEQHFSGQFSTKLMTSNDIRAIGSGPIFHKNLPNAGFTAKIPFVGQLHAGAFVKLDWDADVKIGTTISSTAQYSIRKREEVTAQIYPPFLTSRNIEQPQNGKGSFTIRLSSTQPSRFGMSGFLGVRPAIGASITLGKRGVEGNIGASVGVQIATEYRKAPFMPFLGSGLKMGSCNQCHFIEGPVSIRGKRLSSQLILGGFIQKEKTLLYSLFQQHIGTLCSFATQCPI